MTAFEIKQLVISVVSSLGGITGVVLIVRSILKFVGDMRVAKSNNKLAKTIENQTKDICATIDEHLTCALDVDFSAAINPLAEDIRSQFVDNTASQAKQLYDLKELVCANTRILSKSNKLSADEKSAIGILVDSLDESIATPKRKNSVKLTGKAVENQPKVKEDKKDDYAIQI